MKDYTVKCHIQETMDKFHACTSLPIMALREHGTIFGSAEANEHLAKVRLPDLYILAMENLLAVENLQKRVSSEVTVRGGKDISHVSLGTEALAYSTLWIDPTKIELGVFMVGPYTTNPVPKCSIPYRPADCIPYLASLLRTIQDDIVPTATPGHVVNLHVQKAIRYVQKHYHQNVTLEAVAGMLHINKCYFANIFREETGQTFSEFVNQQRIEASKDALQRSNVPILEVALENGFSSQSYYGRTFKKLTGMTPSEFRRKAQGAY